MRLTIFLTVSLLLAKLVSAQPDLTPWTPFHAEPLQAQLRLVRTGNAISWPALGNQTTFRIVDRMSEWDGMPARYIDFTGGGLALQVPFSAMESWRLTNDPTGRYPYELAHQFDEQARFGFTAVRRASFLAGLDDPSWNRYLGSLGIRPNAWLITNDDNTQNTSLLQVLGGRTRVLEYRFSGEESTDPVRAVMQIFVDLGSGTLVVFSLECAAANMPLVGPDFSYLVGSFEFAEN